MNLPILTGIAEIDDKSLDYAKKNVALNNFTSRIYLQKTAITDPILNDKLIKHRFDFTLCNPPFYASQQDFEQSASEKNEPPNSNCTGAPNEMICLGGEVAFVSQMIDESLALRNDVQWFTSMLGKISSVPVIVEKLQEVGIGNWAVTEFAPGKQTKRWGIAWSFEDLRPNSEIARGAKTVDKKFLPFPSQYSFLVSEERFSLVH